MDNLIEYTLFEHLGDRKIAELLITNGANAVFVERNGYSILHWAIHNGNCSKYLYNYYNKINETT